MTPLVVIPMAGEGRRFKEAGYTFPKFLVTIRGKPMIQWVIESLQLPAARYVFACRSEHIAQYHLEEMFHQLVHDVTLVPLGATPQGAAVTVNLALKHLADDGTLPADSDLLIVNSDQWLVWKPEDFFRLVNVHNSDGAIAVFPSVHPKWSFARLDETNTYVKEVAEKRPISPWATCGLYYWQRARDFQREAEAMFKDGVMVNQEYYVAPVYNRAIQQGAKVLAYGVQEMYGLGTPEDVEEFRIAVASGYVDPSTTP